jgi:hypothetical protein
MRRSGRTARFPRPEPSVPSAFSRERHRPPRDRRNVTYLDPEVRTALAELHENVLQRVYATGVGLQALVGDLPDEQLADRLRTHIADLDVTLDEIRTTLFELRGGLTPTR